ncbi:MAG TPA: hypothetical protein VGP41_17400 [Candidatus Lustribacter sp.]|nr:hypothetical protein [Candidatus Lustribacter sp.]
MNDIWGNLLPIAVAVFFFASLVRRLSRRAERVRAPRAPAPAPRPVRRRLSEPAAPAPVTVSVRAPIVPAMSDMLSAEAAAAFPALDLSLGDIGTAPGAPKRRARRALGGLAIGSRGWGANAIVAAEVLGTPVGLRSGATVGVPHAF